MRRPSYGRAGSVINVEANFVSLRIPTRLRASQYAVQLFRDKTERGKTVQREVSATELISFNRNCFKVLLEKYGHEFGCNLAYNGRSIAYAPTEINRKALGNRYKIRVDKDGEKASKSDSRWEEVEIVLSHAKYLNYQDLFSGSVETTATSEFIACLDVVLAQAAAVGHVQVGRSFYNSDNATPLGRRNVTSSAWTGFYQSVRMSHLGLLVNMDESFTAFWNKGRKPLASLLSDANDRRELSCRDGRALRDVAQRLKGLKVKAMHTGIVYRVYGFSDRGADRITFDSDGRRVSITQYFADQYGIRLKRGGDPCVRTHPKRDTYLPIECLAVVPNQRVAGVLSQDETMTMVKTASTKPHIRRNNAARKIQQLKYHDHPICRDFRVQVDPNLVRLKARVLPAPTIHYAEGVVRPQNGQWRAKNGVSSPSIVFSWAVLNMARVSKEEVQQFIRDLISAMGRARMKIQQKLPRLYACDERDVEREMQRIAQEYRRDKSLKMSKPCLQLLILIKERQDSRVYNAIKREADLNLGIVSQVCLAKHCGSRARGRDMYCDNLVLKINAKLGGQNGRVAPYSMDKSARMADVDFINTPHIILGADVTHPMPGGKGPSVAALVGSRDRYGLQFSSSMRSQTGRKEMITDIGEMFKEVYSVWYNAFGKKVHAQKIIMFRDGVSEGQFEEVMQREVFAIRRACVQMSDAMRPSITYIIVTKRHHTRFFPPRDHGDRSGNIPPGTVVDSEITSKEYYDFYLNSHAGIQGTNKPSKYTVLIDENKINPDALYGFIYRLSHSFARCNRPVSMVHSAYYAHLLAFRGRAYLGDDMSDTASQASSSSHIPPVPLAHGILRGHLYFV
ncbi:Protein argonaute 3 [Gracilaria domingensis]|nr:Protein argonaute 3 [Gracilaria domingensis]